MRHNWTRRWITGLLSLILAGTLAGCGAELNGGGGVSPSPSAGPDNSLSTPTPMPGSETGKSPAPQETQTGVGSELSIMVTIGEEVFGATLLDSEAARALGARLPLTLEMSDLNGNEKYFYLDESLPAASESPGQIYAGDLMLYGSDCLVLFYETFSSGYSYTRLGGIDNPAGLAAALGSGGVTVTFAPA